MELKRAKKQLPRINRELAKRLLEKKEEEKSEQEAAEPMVSTLLATVLHRHMSIYEPWLRWPIGLRPSW